MSSAQTTAVQPGCEAALRAENAALQEQLESLKTQLDWFKRQLFGRRSEKRLIIDPAGQADLLAGLNEASPKTPPPATETITYERRKQRGDTTVTDSGLRFDDSVPVETIDVPNPDLDGVPASERVVIGEKISYRLAQRPGSYVVLKYVRRVVRRNDTGAILIAPLPANVLDKSVADVSFLAGLLVDKFVYHLPLYRQHQRLKHSGIDNHYV